MANPGNEDKNGSACLASIRSNSIDCRFHEIYIYRERGRESCYRMGKERREKKRKARGRESDTTWHRPIGSIISSFHANSAPNIRFSCGGEENPILAIGFSLTFRNYIFIAA